MDPKTTARLLAILEDQKAALAEFERATREDKKRAGDQRGRPETGACRFRVGRRFCRAATVPGTDRCGEHQRPQLRQVEGLDELRRAFGWTGGGE